LAQLSWRLRRQVLPAGDRGDDARELVHAVGERRRAGLEDEGALHLVELVLAHRAHLLPARASADLLPFRLPPTPACDPLPSLAREDLAPSHLPPTPACGPHIRAAALALLRREDPPIGAVLPARLAADGIRAHQFQQLRAPPDPGDQRLVPLLEEGAHPAG